MIVEIVEDKKRAVGVDKTIFTVHYHEDDDKPKALARREISHDLILIQKNPLNDEAKAADARHKLWLSRALSSSDDFLKTLNKRGDMKTYIERHPGASGKQIRDAFCSDMDPHAICNMKRRMFGVSTNLREILENGGHHLLGHDGDKIVVFGRSTAFNYLSTCPLIQSDGTFECVVSPFSQLYIIHGIIKNGVSFPLLYCLVKGKTQAIYERLLNLVERLAGERGVTVFNRPVQVMIDFELPFINAMSQYTAGQSITCCFFHFVANIRKRTTSLNADIKEAAGQNKEMLELAMKTKRALMMLPLLPEELITPNVLDVVIGRWARAFPNHAALFNGLKRHLLCTYVRRSARFPPRLWSVSGRKVRTNNAAESTHSRLNASIQVSGAVTLDMFLVAIETDMRNASMEIKAGCKSHSKIFEILDELLVHELAQLVNGEQGVLRFPDHCASIMNVHNQNVRTFVDRRRSEQPDEADKEWADSNRTLVVESDRGLFHRLVPGGERDTETILLTVEAWSFQTPAAEIVIQEEQSELSMVEEGKSRSMLEIERENGR